MNLASSHYNKYSTYLRKSFRKITPQQQNYLGLILSISAVVFFAWFAIRPTLNTISELIKEIEVRREIVVKLDQKINALVAANTVYKTAEPQLAVLDTALPVDHEVAVFAQQVETLAKEVGVELKNFSYQPFPLNKETIIKNSAKNTKKSDKPEAWKSIEFELLASGEYSQLKKLVFEIYNLRRTTLTQRINIQSGQPGNNNSSTLTLNVTGKILYL